MRILLTALPLVALLSSCLPGGGSQTEGAYHSTSSTRELQTDLDIVKHEQNNSEVERRILEGKLSTLEASLSQTREQLTEYQRGSQRNMGSRINELDSQLQQLSQDVKGVLSDIRQLKNHANEVSTSLAQYNEKVKEFERTIDHQNRNIHNLEIALNSLIALEEQRKTAPAEAALFSSLQPYEVKSGDTLEKIARKFQITIDEIKKVNELTSDLIVIGQKLRIPKR